MCADHWFPVCLTSCVNGTHKVIINPNVPNNFQHVITNSGGVVQGTARLNGSMASAGDWIAAFDSSGNTVGSAPLVTSNNDVRFGVGGSNFILYGDNPLTSDIDEGMNQGEDFTLKLWDASRNVILIQADSLGKTLTHSGWASNNFTPIDGYDDPTAIFDFYFIIIINILYFTFNFVGFIKCFKIKLNKTSFFFFKV